METVGAAEGLRAERFLAAEVGPQRLRFGEAADSMHLDAQTIAPIWPSHHPRPHPHPIASAVREAQWLPSVAIARAVMSSTLPVASIVASLPCAR